MKKQKNLTIATKADVEEVAALATKEFTHVHKRIDTVSNTLQMLNEKVDTGFEELCKETHEGFRAVLAAIETVE